MLRKASIYNFLHSIRYFLKIEFLITLTVVEFEALKIELEKSDEKNVIKIFEPDFSSSLKVAQGWKPGAISKRLLRKLNKAKKSKLPVRKVKVAKKVKKNVEEKPTLIICKMNGAYHIEMQASPENSDTNIDQCSPLKYTVISEDNEQRIQKRSRKRQRLIREAVDKVWSDPYHPEVCERTCLKAYKQAIGLLPYDPNNPECTCCSDEESSDSVSCFCEESDTSSEGSSLDLQWEIHFTPPCAHY